MPRQRVIEPVLDRGGNKAPLYTDMPSPSLPRTPLDPVLLQVNWQSRYETLRFFGPRIRRKYEKSSSALIRQPRPGYYPSRFFSPHLDTVLFDCIYDFERGGYSFPNALARCESFSETFRCENLALRLTCLPYMFERFYIWLMAWILWFPNVKDMLIVVDDCLWECDFGKMENLIKTAAFMAEDCIRGRQEDLNELLYWRWDWEMPVAGVVTRTEFEKSWYHGWNRNFWPVDQVLNDKEATKIEFLETAILMMDKSNSWNGYIDPKILKSEERILENGSVDPKILMLEERITEIKLSDSESDLSERETEGNETKVEHSDAEIEEGCTHRPLIQLPIRINEAYTVARSQIMEN